MPLRYLCCLLAALALPAQVVRQATPQLSNPAGRGRGGAAAPAPPPPATDCAVSGTVVNAITGEPIARAMVTLGGNVGSGSSTDASGRWNISGATCGFSVPNATRAGFLPANQTASSIATVQRVQLVSGTPVHDLKIALTPEAAIAGKVQDRNGDPIEGAQIRAMRVVVQNGKRTLANMSNGNSDSQGNFRVGQLLSGRYIVCAASAQVTYPVGGGSASVYKEDCFPGPVLAGLSIAMPVDGGREVRTSFTLTAVPGVHVRGSVAGVPATGASGAQQTRVQLLKLPNGGFGMQGALVTRDGTFDIPAVPPGSYVARAISPSVASTPGGMAPTAQAPVEVGDFDVDGVTLTYQTPGSLSGTVRFELSNAAAAPGGAANSTVNVNLVRAVAAGFIGPPGQVQWDSGHLNFTYPEVAPGQYQINAFAGAAGTYVKSVTLRGQNILHQPFAVDGTTGPVEIVVTDDTGSIDVTVNDSDGHPVAGWVILATFRRKNRFQGGEPLPHGHGSERSPATSTNVTEPRA